MTNQAFFITSDDLFLLDTYKNTLAKKIKETCHCQVIRLSCYGNENIQEQLMELSMPDLFSSKKLLMITAAEGKWNENTAASLEKLLENLSKKPHLFVIIALCEFKSQQLKSKSIQSLQKYCEVKALPIPEGKQLDAWILAQAKKYHLSLNTKAMTYLKDHSKGHFYACDQLLQKCQLLGMNELTEHDLHPLMTDNSKYTIYDLISSMCIGSGHAESILEYLVSQKTAVILILWNIINILKLAYNASFHVKIQGIPISQALDKLWYQQKIDTERVVKRLSFMEISQCLQQAYTLDKIIKRSGESETLMALKELILIVAKGNPLWLH